MDNQRLFLWVTLGFVLWLNYQAWNTDYAPVPEPAANVQEAAGDETALEALPGVPEITSEITTQTGDDASESAIPGLAVPGTETATVESQRPVIKVTTDVFDLTIGLQGGDIRHAILSVYPIRKDDPDQKVSLLSENRNHLYQLQTGLRTTEGSTAPDFQSEFTSSQQEYVLGDGDDELIVELLWDGGQGVTATKIYTFRRGDYAIDVQTRVENRSASAWTGAEYLRLRKTTAVPERSMFDVESFSYTGPVFYDGKKYEKLDTDDLAKTPFEGDYQDGWIASIQHHFVTAAIPPTGENYSYRASAARGLSDLMVLGAGRAVQPGGSEVFERTLFIGPKLQDQMEAAAPALKLTVDYGWLTVISQPLFWVLDKVHGIVGNWGWAIIIVTLLIKLLFYKLTQTSGRSMAKMRKLQPRIKHIQERYKGDREALSKATMDLYKREKVNPVAGCLPMLIQIPFFLAFYWVLLESVELRQAPWMLWITDLSSRDPYFILPVLMGVAMFGQFKLNPAPPDPVQAKVFMIMPVVMTGMMAFFPSGLVLYWLTNTLLSIAQQYRINKVIGAD